MASMKWEQAKKQLAAGRSGSRNRSLEAKANAILRKAGLLGNKQK